MSNLLSVPREASNECPATVPWAKLTLCCERQFKLQSGVSGDLLLAQD